MTGKAREHEIRIMGLGLAALAVLATFLAVWFAASLGAQLRSQRLGRAGDGRVGRADARRVARPALTLPLRPPAPSRRGLSRRAALPRSKELGLAPGGGCNPSFDGYRIPRTGLP